MAMLPTECLIGQGLLSLATMLSHIFIYKTHFKDPSLVPLLIFFIVIPLYGIGLLGHFTSLSPRAQRYSGSGLLVGANTALAWQLIVGQDRIWYEYLLNAIWPAFLGMFAGAVAGTGHAVEESAVEANPAQQLDGKSER